MLGIHPVFEIVLVLLFAGFFAWLISVLPFIAQPFKQIAQGFVLFAALIWLLLVVYHAFFGGPVVVHRW
jgi:hypothetical protein